MYGFGGSGASRSEIWSGVTMAGWQPTEQGKIGLLSQWTMDGSDEQKYKILGHIVLKNTTCNDGTLGILLPPCSTAPLVLRRNIVLAAGPLSVWKSCNQEYDFR